MIPTRLVLFGATSAIATSLARQWVAAGRSIYCVARDGEKLAALLDDLRVRAPKSNVHIDGTQADLTDLSRHETLWEQAESALGGRIDSVLLAWGTLPDQRECERSTNAMLEAINTNGTSTLALLGLAANRLEARGEGVIAAIGSVAGDRGRQSNYVYGTAKAMIDRFMQGLRNRLARKGVAVVTIKPGFIDTPMTADFPKGALWAQPDAAAQGILKAIDRGTPVAYVPGFWRLIMLVIRLIPESIFKRLSL